MRERYGFRGVSHVLSASYPRTDPALPFRSLFLLPAPPVETHGPLGTLWAGLGLGAFFLALTWVNLLLGHFLTPLFLIPATWVMDAVQERKARRAR
jgi:hypothetical protein